MQVATTFVMATIVGLFLFMFVVPQTSVWLAGWVKKTRRLGFLQKIRLLNLLERVSAYFSLKGLRQSSFLAIVFLAMIGIQQYFLFVGNDAGAKIIVTGMFVLVIAESLQDL